MEKQALRTVYITKDWETKGIYELQVIDSSNKGAVKVIGDKWGYFSSKQWHEKYADAVTQVTGLRDAKIKVLMDKIEKLKSIIL